MKGYEYYYINDERLKLPHYEAGDRVKVGSEKGTVERVEHGGLFVYVHWDNQESGYGSCRLVSNVKPENDCDEVKECVFCHRDVDVSRTEKFEYGDEGEIWCSPCFIRESDTGE